MTQTSSTVSQGALRGVASGVFFMAFFSTLWGLIGVGGLEGWGSPWFLIIVALIGILLLVGGIILFRVLRRLPASVPSREDAREGRRIGLWFGLVFAAEGVLIAIASVICNLLNRFDLFFPITAIIVGLHFLPLAYLFGVRLYYLVGVLLCILGLITLAVPVTATVGGQQIDARLVIVGFGAALILWCVGIGLWLLGRRWLAAG